MEKKITVLLVDDHSLVRRGFRRMLEDEPDMKVCGGRGRRRRRSRENGEGAAPAGCAVMDCALPGMNGLQATREILEDASHTAILMLSMHTESTWVRQAIDAGAKGYMLKNALELELGAAIRKVAAGETFFDPQVEQSTPLKGERAALTQRELEVLQMIVDGKSNKEIAIALDLSANTVAVHRANIMNTLGIHKTAELVVYAIRAGLVNVP